MTALARNSPASNVHEEFQDHGKGLGVPTSTHKDRLDAITDDPTEEVNVDDVNDPLNYYMYKICDYPANVFVWPDKTGGDPTSAGEYDDGKAMDRNAA
jgi:hypothetical protein